jgi:hypothetical protein
VFLRVVDGRAEREGRISKAPIRCHQHAALGRGLPRQYE